MSIELIHSSRTSTFTRPSPNSVSKHGSSEVDWRVESPRSPLRSWVSFWLGHLIAFEVAFFYFCWLASFVGLDVSCGEVQPGGTLLCGRSSGRLGACLCARRVSCVLVSFFPFLSFSFI